MTAAIRNPSGSKPSTTSGAAATDNIPPVPASAANARPRAVTRPRASSNDRAPAKHAAATSPCEWPTTADGTTPAASHTLARPTIITNNDGWTTSTRSSPTPDTSASRSGKSTSCSHSATNSANTGEQASSSRPIPIHCEP
ncbi:hypothetical protein GCM10022420_061870 [Streptomyces iranensis]